MAKKKITLDLFARIVVPAGTDPNTVVNVVHNACSSKGWDFSASIEEEGEGDTKDLLLNDDFDQFDDLL